MSAEKMSPERKQELINQLNEIKQEFIKADGNFFFALRDVSGAFRMSGCTTPSFELQISLQLINKKPCQQQQKIYK